MKFDIITNNGDFDRISNEWNELLACCSASSIPFLRHEYLRAWWEMLGGGEWNHGELCIVTARDEKENLVGIAPLFFTHNDKGSPALLFLGSIEISDYLDLIVPPNILSEFSSELFTFLLQDDTYPWQVIDLYNIIETSPSIQTIKDAAKKHGMNIIQEKLQHCPYILLPDNWDAYLANIKKKQRHEIRRKMRRAQESETPVQWYIVEDGSNLDKEIDDFLYLMKQDEEKNHFLTEVMQSQMRSIIHTAFQAGWLQLSFLTVGDEKAAGYLNFDFANHVWVYNSGLNYKYRQLSPGWVLLGHLLKWSIENGRTCFDFMRGDEAYKYRFGGIDRFIMRLKINRN
jgi:CelD/BcsL family acetyltransferase involved in cellulose biosynthesis